MQCMYNEKETVCVCVCVTNISVVGVRTSCINKMSGPRDTITQEGSSVPEYREGAMPDSHGCCEGGETSMAYIFV